jgi:hypothetical protein
MISIHVDKSNISNDDISILTSTDTTIDILSPSSSLSSIDNKESYQLNELTFNKSYNDNHINESLSYKKDINRTIIYDQRLVILITVIILLFIINVLIIHYFII